MGAHIRVNASEATNDILTDRIHGNTDSSHPTATMPKPRVPLPSVAMYLRLTEKVTILGRYAKRMAAANVAERRAAIVAAVEVSLKTIDVESQWTVNDASKSVRGAGAPDNDRRNQNGRGKDGQRHVECEVNCTKTWSRKEVAHCRRGRQQ